MLYVFQVDVGRMLSFDMTVALSSVENLKETVERLHGIPAANIVFLVSGGEVLAPNTQVSCYSAGTDTNPIYMFLTGGAKLLPPMPNMDGDVDLSVQIQRSIDLPPVYETLTKRAQLALRMYDMAREEDRYCERLVHEQHLQQQGWRAVVANLEDLVEEFRLRFQHFFKAFDKHLEGRPAFLELLKNFADDLSKLSRIPILPGLMPMAEPDFHGFDELLENDDDVFSRSSNPQKSVLMIGATAATGDETLTEDSDDVAAKGSGNNGAVGNDNADDRSSSTTSTSPNKKLKMSNESNMNRGSQTSLISNTSRRLNLLQWITSKENHNVLKNMSEECIQGLQAFDERVYENLKAKVETVITLAGKKDVRTIRGLSDRLRKLEEFKYKIKEYVKDQKELSAAFQQYQARAKNLGDNSILPDLCKPHQSQLLVMLQNYKTIREHRQCIVKAKEELGKTVHMRLGRIVEVENQLSEVDYEMVFYLRSLRRAERHIHIIEQIHQAPSMYIAAVTEVMRRKIFSTEFRLWASKLAEDFDSIHSEEMKRRQDFNMSFQGHFLNILFPGMGDMPPAFANENPLIFDAHLPNITRSDIDVLTAHLPEMTSQIKLPDMEPVIYFFVSRSGSHQRERFEELLKLKQKRAAGELKQISAEDEQSVSGKMPSNPRLNELRKDASGSATGGGDESETDTETEFEQVCPNNQQSVATSTTENLEKLELISKSTLTENLLTQSAETLTEENAETLRSEVEKMRLMLGAMSKLALECIYLHRSKLKAFRQVSLIQKEDLQSDLQALNDKLNVLRMQSEAREHELMLQQSQKDQEILKLREELKRRDDELQQERNRNIEMSAMKLKCITLEDQLKDLREKLEIHEAEKEHAVSEAREKLIHEHKTEIESLRQRFKLMTSMERSPSDLSLENNLVNENVIEKHVHETILSQVRSELESEKERSIKAAIELERSIWQSTIFPLNSESVMANVNVLKDLLEEKERQLEQLREKDLMLTKENLQLSSLLNARRNEDANVWLNEKIDFLKRDKKRLEEELNQEKSKRIEMESSIAALKCSVYDPLHMSRSKSTGSSHRLLVLEGCTKGDVVFVVWNMRHGQFVVVQDHPSLYFVHGDSLPALNLRLPPTGEESIIPIPYYAIGRVTEKEYCVAKKDENRYRVNRGSKFYRIKLVPFVLRQLSKRERFGSFSTSISRSISQCDSHSEVSQTSSVTTETSTSVTATSLAQSANTSSGIGTLQKDGLVISATTNTYSKTLLATSPIKVITTTATEAPTVATTAAAIQSYKERTMSITSVSEEDDEPTSLLSERCRYISVSEEDEHILDASGEDSSGIGELNVASSLATQNKNLQLNQTTVITEQPTATASKFELDFLLASADINNTTQANATIAAITKSTQDISYESFTTTLTNTTATTDNFYTEPMITSDLTGDVCADNNDYGDGDGGITPKLIASSSSLTPTASTLLTESTNTSPAATLIPSKQESQPQQLEINEKSSPSIPTPIGTTSEDSDEYRSLEPKDDTDFPISE